MSYAERSFPLPDHPLIGTIVKVEARIYTHDGHAPQPYELEEPLAVLLTYADGRQVRVTGMGYEYEGLDITESVPVAE